MQILEINNDTKYNILNYSNALLCGQECLLKYKNIIL